MASIYVDPSASTNGTGSEANPRNLWPTGIGAGDIIYLKRGTRLSVSSQLSMGGGSDNTVTFYGDLSLPKPIITSTATNQGLISVGVAGVTTFDGIHFDNCLNMAANGGVIAAQQVSGGRAANLKIINCKFTSIGVNAILLNGTNTATLSSTFECSNCIFYDIGADCVFGGALDYVFAYNHCTKISSRGISGDAVGFINGDPTRVWIHHNYINHSDVDSKQCIIVDTTTPGTGLCLIEDNVLVGWGSLTTSPELHNVIISDPVTKIRRNIIYTYGIACGVNTASDEITDNLILIGNTNNLGPPVAILATGAKIKNNTFVGLKELLPEKAAVVMGNPATDAEISCNLFLNLPRGVQSNVVGQNPTCTKNAYWQVTEPRIGSSGAFSEATEITADPLLTPSYRIKAGSPLIAAGTFVETSKDINENTRWNPPSIGAYEYMRPRTMRS